VARQGRGPTATLPLLFNCAKPRRQAEPARLEEFMADHADVQYAAADGNDLPAHEAGYSQFVEVIVIGTALVVNILFGLAIGGVIGNWLPGGFVIVAGVVAAAISGWTGLRIVSFAMVAISALLLLLNAYG
jgi:hypothetical protein